MLETNRLILRKFKKSDAEDIFQYLNKTSFNSLKKMEMSNFDEAVKGALIRSEDDLCLAITLKESEKVIGEISFHTLLEDSTTYVPIFIVNKKFQGKGYGYEAVEKVVNYLFLEKKARRICIFFEDYNKPCQKICEKLQFRKEGVFLDFCSFVNDKEGNPIYENAMQYALLKREWENMLRLEKPSEEYLSSYTDAYNEDIHFRKDDVKLCPPDVVLSNKNIIDENDSTMLWLVKGHDFIGTITIRNKINEDADRYKGHIDFYIRYSMWNKGYGLKLLKMGLEYAKKELSLDRLLLTCDSNNIASCKIIESNKGILENKIYRINEKGNKVLVRRYWIENK